MPCYRVNWVVTEDRLTAMHQWLEENHVAANVIRTVAHKGPDREGDGTCWFTKFVFSTESGVRMFYRRWADNYRETDEIRAWN